MRPIPLSFQTMYADLVQTVRGSSLDYGSIVRRKRRGRTFLYAVSKDGSTRREQYLGPAEDASARERAEDIRHIAKQARSMRAAVAALKRARVPAPSLSLGRVLEVIANAGLFQQGVLLIGTAAYQTYACPLGHYLSAGGLMTNDADLLVASFVDQGEPKDIGAILSRADPTFRPAMNLEDKLPSIFRADDRFQVDVLTKYGRGRISPVQFKSLGCSAVALAFMEYLCEESMEVVSLYGAGVLVRIPPPMRYAIHKLLIAPERSKHSVKQPKDLLQAAELLEILEVIEPDAVHDAMAAAKRRGPRWRRNIEQSLAGIAAIRRP